MPVYYFDKWGNPIEKPVAQTVDAGVTSQTVLENYIKAIGGMEKAKSVKTLKYTGATVIEGAPMEVSVLMIYAQGNSKMEMNMGSMALVKQVITPKSGYLVQQGRRSEIEDEDLTDAQANSMPIKELSMLSRTTVELIGIEKIDDSDAYVLKDGKKKYYYNVKTGLKAAESTDYERNGQAGTTFTYYRDYRDLNGVLIPFNVVQDIGILMDIKFNEILMNTDVSDADFE